MEGQADQPLRPELGLGHVRYFKEHALAKGDQGHGQGQTGSSGVVQSIATDKFAIGYSGIGFQTADVRAVPLAKDDKGDPIEAIPDNAYSGKYPLARFLYVYVNLKSGEGLDPLRNEFLRFVLSKQGQEAVVKDGFYPLPPRFVEEGLKKAGIAAPKTAEASSPQKGK
jgi:phosphate transport system substrate-binding protein